MSVIEAAHRISDQIYKNVQHAPDMVWNFYFEPLPRLFTDHSDQLGGNIMGLNRTQEDLIGECPHHQAYRSTTDVIQS